MYRKYRIGQMGDGSNIQYSQNSFLFSECADKSMFIMTLINLVSTHHRRRMETEGKAKVVKSIWGATFFQSLPRKLFCLGLFVRNDRIQPVYLEETVEFNRFFQIDRNKTASAARNWTNFPPQTDATIFALPYVSILLLCCKLTERPEPVNSCLSMIPRILYTLGHDGTIALFENMLFFNNYSLEREGVHTIKIHCQIN